jgi:5-methyltetrahydrofolate--homocysteine methyltransferase
MNALPFGNGVWNPGDKVLLADGAWGTELMKLGLVQGESPEAWNLNNAAAVLSVARSYVDAGSDLILTNSFGASSLQLARHNLADRAAEINRRAAELSLQAALEGAVSPEGASRTVLVAGDIGPSGKLFNMGEVAEEDLFRSFAEQAAALRDGGARWLLVETMIDRCEMDVAVRAAAQTGLPVIASMTYTETASGYRTVMGDTPEDCVETALAAGASVVGANCGSGIEAYVDLARHLRSLTDKPLWIKANAGVPEVAYGRTVYPMDPSSYCSWIPALLDAGVNIIGGCCGTGPEFIRTARGIIP